MTAPLSGHIQVPPAYWKSDDPGTESAGVCGVADGTRTRDVLDHNQVLYQLNYSHHRVALKATGRA